MGTNTDAKTLLARMNLDLIYPAFRQKIEQLVVNCAARGVDYYAISGLRSWQEQEKIYAQGRTERCEPCKKSNAACRHIISKAPPGWSPHNYGVAMDFARDKDLEKRGLQPDWDEKQYEVLAEEAEKLGLTAGQHWRNFKDPPHIQLPLEAKGIKWKTLIELYKKGGMGAVWRFLDTFKW